jgi:hypothetical protein
MRLRTMTASVSSFTASPFTSSPELSLALRVEPVHSTCQLEVDQQFLIESPATTLRPW